MIPHISVVIPTFNRAQLLRSSLESLATQSLPAEQYEIVVVNDGSTDETVAVCQEFETRVNLRCQSIDNSGISAAKNLGLFMAVAPIVLFFDDDDLATPRLLEHHLRAHADHPDETDAVLGYTCWGPGARVTPVMEYVIDVGQQLFAYKNLRDGQKLDYTYFWGGRSSCKRSFLAARGVFNPIFRFGSEDIELGYRLSRFGLKVIYSRHAVQYMNRPVTFEEFCKRCEKQGASQYHFSRVHADLAIQEYCQIAAANQCWNQVREPMGMGFYRVREIESMLASDPQLIESEPLRSELRSLYKWTFDCFKMRGIIHAQHSMNNPTEAAAGIKASVISPIVVFQMGKVGSKTIEASLKAYDPTLPVCHSHLLNGLDRIEERVKATRKNPGQTLVEVNHGRQLRNTILGTNYIHCRVISLVRDPVARNISAFFENIIEFFPDFYTRYAAGELDIETIVSMFLERFDHDTPLVWFDFQMKPVFGIDVFACPFSTERGYSIYDGQNASLLLIKLEKLQDCVESAMKEFLGIDKLVIRNTNVAEGKEYREVYKAFLESVRLPHEYVDRMYESKMVQHFYEQDEIRSFRKKWAKQRAKSLAAI